MSRFDQRIKLFAGKRQGFVLLWRDLLDLLGRILRNPALFHAEEKERDDALVLVVAGGWRALPGVNPASQRRNIQLREKSDRHILTGTPLGKSAESEAVLSARRFRTIEPHGLLKELVDGRGDLDLSFAAVRLVLELELQLANWIERVEDLASLSFCFLPTASLGACQLALPVTVDVEPLHAIASRPIRTVSLRAIALVPRVDLYGW